ncbi:MAG: hypothetical protein BMS9Abin37_3319 [Acidobacteriota bacterium]|nr:MAG: hypothetical protein BMS9Abin37_3319 [Acidobacteriota bacterium]
MDLAELLTVETSVLRTLCLTVNSETSELKNRITENLIVDDFYFPITKSIFGAISDLSKNGMNVDPNSLEQALGRRSVDVPDDFFLEDLFRGEAPSPQTLTKWIGGLNSMNSMNSVKSVKSGNGNESDTAEGEAPDPKEHYLEQTHPSVKSKEAETPLAPPPTEAVAPEPATKPAPPKKTKPDTPPPAKDVLAPESGEWLGYLAELTKKQGEHLKTGFSGLDAEWGGLGPGLLLLAGEERERLLDFLKQLVDQIAFRCRVPCLYLSFERSKAELRLQTLSRLSEAPATHIRDGRYDKDSAEWKSIIRAGEQAVEWLQRIYTVEATSGLAVTGIRELRQGLMDSGAGATCMIAVDNLHKLASKSDLLQSVAELKELAESLGIVVIGVADNVEIVHERSADMAVKFTEDDSVSILEVHVSGAAKPTTLRFDYHADTHRFEERL